MSCVVSGQSEQSILPRQIIAKAGGREKGTDVTISLAAINYFTDGPVRS